MTKSINYTYKSAVNRIEKFMMESGIRSYCEDYCKGYCCDGCYERDTACHMNEGRRLACSHFICARLRLLIFDTLSENKYSSLGLVIRKRLAKASMNNHYRNPYFMPYTRKQMEKFRIPKSVFDENLPTGKEVETIRYKINALKYLTNIAKGNKNR